MYVYYRPVIGISFFISHVYNMSAFISLPVALSFPHSLLLKSPSSIYIYIFRYWKSFHLYISVLFKICRQLSHHQIIINSTFWLNKFRISYSHASAQGEQRGNPHKTKCNSNLHMRPFVFCMGLQTDVINAFLISTQYLVDNKLKRNKSVQCYIRMEHQICVYVLQLWLSAEDIWIYGKQEK